MPVPVRARLSVPVRTHRYNLEFDNTYLSDFPPPLPEAQIVFIGRWTKRKKLNKLPIIPKRLDSLPQIPNQSPIHFRI